MIYNSQQENIINMGVHHILHSPEQVFEYDGEAGTGKSVILFEMLRRSGIKLSEVLPMAYTGQAAIVMRTKGFLNAVTTHSGLFEVEDTIVEENGNIEMDTHFNAPRVVTKFVPKDKLDSNIKLIIIDEGYMVPEEMKYIIEKHGIKVIVTGDKEQLPPVKSRPAYLYRDDIPHLTELMRQNENDGIVYIARRARHNQPIHCGRYGNVLVIEESELTDQMIMMSDILLCGTNKRREYLNNYIRHNLLGISDTLPVFGDRMICRKNNWNVQINGISLANGLVGTVTIPPNVSNYSDNQYVMDFMPDLINDSFHTLCCDYNYLIADYNEKNEIRNSKFQNGELFEYAYASTTHLCQGSEYNGGIYIEEYMGNIQNNLNYVGATRFKKWLIYVKKSRKYY